LKSERKAKAAKLIVSFFKRILISLIIIAAYVYIYNNHFIHSIDNLFYKGWFLQDTISYYEFIKLVFHAFWIILILFILFQTQIFQSYRWQKKYSKI